MRCVRRCYGFSFLTIGMPAVGAMHACTHACTRGAHVRAQQSAWQLLVLPPDSVDGKEEVVNVSLTKNGTMSSAQVVWKVDVLRAAHTLPTCKPAGHETCQTPFRKVFSKARSAIKSAPC